MPELSVRFTTNDQADGAPLQVALLRPETGAATSTAPFRAPLDDPELADLRWYLEVFASWPTGPDYARARRIEGRFQQWGQDLLESVLDTDEAVRLWQQFLDDQGTKLLTIDATDPRILRLPWELLADSSGHLFARQISIRRRLRRTMTTTSTRTFELPVRVLVVVSRPDGSGFIPPRAVSKPLLDALDRLGDRVETEFLYPPTLPALSARLYDESAPPVHVVHFDGHGVYDEAQSLGYLLFEDDEHKPDLVDANRLGTLLNQCGVPLMVLNACHSARQDVRESVAEGNPFASVAARLIRSGVSSVLAMNYSVLVIAAQKFVEAFYGGLAGGVTVGRAVDRARRALLADPARHTLPRRDEQGQPFDEVIRLRDWFLPALYQQTEDPVAFPREGDGAAPVPRAIPRALTDPSVPGGLPPEPPHGFHGRAREMLRLERELADRAIVVLHGFGGMGKTSLAAEAGRWFYRTGRFPGGAAFVSFEHGGSLQQLCSWVGQAISGDPNFSLGEGDPVQQVADLLAQKPALVILDNFESVLGADPLMPLDELKAVLDAVWHWAQTGARSGATRTGSLGSRVLITTRSVQFNDGRFEQGKHCAHVPLEGLERDDALELAGSILENLGIDRDRVDREGLVALMDHLGGHPLSLNLVLPQLKDHSPARLIERFEEMLPGFTSGAAKERHESLEVSLDFSLRRLGDETRAALPMLSVFRGVCLEDSMLQITGIDPELWRTARAELEAAGLVRAESLPGVNPVFLTFHPTLLPYLDSHLPPDRRGPLETRYWQRYYDLSKFLYHNDTQYPHQVRTIATHELPNLRHAFRLTVDAVVAGKADPVEAVDFADSIARFLDLFGRWRERDRLLSQLDRVTISGEGGVTKAEYLRESQRSELMLQQGRVDEAEQVCRRLLARIEAGTAYGRDEADYDRASTLMRLGRCLESQGRPSQAIERHEAALRIFLRLSPTSQSAREMLGRVYTDLGDNLAAVGRYDEARKAYEDGLEISRQLDDQRSVGVKLNQLGTLALRQRQLDEARQRYHEALQTFRTMGEPQAEAVIWHQLGMVAQRERDWDEAEHCYREAVRIRQQIHDLPELAGTYNQLAIVAEGAGRLRDAEQWYLRAIEGFERTQQQHHAATASYNLADFYLGQGRLEEARRYAERSVRIVETLDLSAEPWKDYNLMARISERQGRPDEAVEWRRKSREVRDAFPGTRYEMQRLLGQFGQFVATVALAAQGNQQARGAIEGSFAAIRQNGWQIEEPFRRIWAGERDPEALTSAIDYQDRALVLAVLYHLGVQVPDVIAQVMSAQAGASPGGPAPTPPPGTPPQPGPGAGPSPGAPGKATGQPQGQGQDEQFSLDQLFTMVATACRPAAPPGLKETLNGLMHKMMTDPATPEPAKELARVLSAVLSGERDPDLSRLLPELADGTRRMLQSL